MIRVLDASIRAADAASVTVHFILRDDSGDGIRRVDVLDRERVRIHREEGDCAELVEFDVVALRTALPLWVQGEDCAGRLTDPDAGGPFLLPLPSPGGVSLCGGPLLCLSPTAECIGAEVTLASARSALASRCGECTRLRRRHSEAERLCAALSIALLVLFAAAAAALAGGGIFGFVTFLFIMVIVAFVAVQWVQACHDEELLRAGAERCEAQEAELRRQFEEALAATLTHCCPECLTGPASAPC